MRKDILIISAAALTIGGALAITGCTSDADEAARNLSTAAEQFEVQRRVTVINGFTDSVVFEVEGRCSLESTDSALAGSVEVTCKIGPNEFAKHYIMAGDNGLVMMQQLETVDVSVYHHRVIIKPENILPEFDYEGGEQ